MGFSYSIFEKDSVTPQKLDPEGRDLLNLLQAVKKGEIFINRPGDQNKIQLKIKYDVDIAEVEVMDANSPPGVTVFYNDASAVEMRKPIYQAMTVLAEIDLLNKLYALKDEKICDIIAKNHFDPNNSDKICVKNTALKSINDTLISILKIEYSDNKRSIYQSDPAVKRGRIIQAVLKEVLSIQEPDRVLSLNQVSVLIKEINDKVNESVSQEAAIPSP